MAVCSRKVSSFLKRTVAVAVGVGAIFTAFGAVAESRSDAEAELKAKLPEIFAKAAQHYKALDAAATPLMKEEKEGSRVPHGFNRKARKLDMRPVVAISAGSFPGSLWYLYEATGDAHFKDRATAWTELFAPNVKVTGYHDVAQNVLCTYGNARRLLKTDKYDGLLVEMATTLCRRFNEDLGFVRSWGPMDEKNAFLVVPDSMMTLELLEEVKVEGEGEGEGEGGGRRFDRIARSHADATMRYLFRPDGGCRHIVDLDVTTKCVRTVWRGQGADCMTAWSCGQSKSVYGYTMMYRLTKDVRYLDFAKKLADYAINHPNMPADGVPYWDYGAPGEERDSAAAAVLASALLELSQFAGAAEGARYRAFAVQQLRTLSSSAYFSEGAEAGHFLLKHGVGSRSEGEIDTPLAEGDYYYLEALLRFRKIALSGPALMTCADGTKVDSVAKWEQVRRPELVRNFLRNVYGVRPVERPADLKFELVREDREAFGGRAVRKYVRISFGGLGGRTNFIAQAVIPKSALTHPAPCFLFCCNRDPNVNMGEDRKTRFWDVEGLIARGYATVGFFMGDVVRDLSYEPGYWDDESHSRYVSRFNNEGVFSVFERPGSRTPESWGTISAWAWGASRVMDWIETEPLIDAKHVGVVGHSRGGKCALVAGVTDTRFAMTCSNDSGCTGAKLNRMDLPGSESVARINTAFPDWFCAAYKGYNGREKEMPFDQHEWLALIAPRLLAVASASKDDWAGPRGEFAAAALASPTWDLYGKKGLVAPEGFPASANTALQQGCVSYHLREGEHDLNEWDWARYMDFADRHGWRSDLEREFTFASWNIGHFSLGLSSASTIPVAGAETKAAAYRRFLAEVNADVLGVCEFSEAFATNGAMPSKEAVFADYPRTVEGPCHAYQWNAQFLRRGTLLGTRMHEYGKRAQGVYWLETRVKICGEEVVFVETHLDWCSLEVRAAQMRELVERFKDVPRVVIAGDFNPSVRFTDGRPSLDNPSEFNVFVEAGFTLGTDGRYKTYPAENPVRTLDNIIVKGLKLRNFRVWPRADLSDHALVSAELGL